MSSRGSDELTDWTAGVPYPLGASNFFFLLHSVRIGSGAHTASYPMGTGYLFSGVKQSTHGADHWPPSSAEIKKHGAIPPLPHTSSFRGAQGQLYPYLMYTGYVLLSGAWTGWRILFTFDVEAFIDHRSVPGEYERSSSGNEGPLHRVPKHKLSIFSKTVLAMCIKF
jgi:hypothetical protein